MKEAIHRFTHILVHENVLHVHVYALPVHVDVLHVYV